MEKIDKFLKIIWSINGVIFILFVFFSLYPRIGYLFYKRQPPRKEGLIVGAKLDSASTKGFRLQRISPGTPKLLAKSGYYMINLLQHDLKKPVKDLDRPVEQRISVRVFSNVLFIKKNGNDRHLLFDRQVGISRSIVPYDGPRIFYIVVEEDTNNDGRLNQLDAKSLYSSNHTGRDLKKIEFQNCSLKHYHRKENEDLVYLTYIYDKNLDGKFTEADYEILKELNLSTGSIKDIINEEMIEEIHQVVFK
jgi:hypothetical protein